MRRTGRILAALLLPFNVWAIEENELIKNLKSRMHTLQGKKGAVITSFKDHSQSYIYDQALAIIAFTKAGEKENAKKLLQALQSFQKKDGSLYFSYGPEGDSPYPRGGDKRIAGSIAWVGIAASQYQKTFRSDEFLRFNTKILSYLQSQMIPIKGKNLSAVKFAPVNFKDTRFPEHETIALEHNLDAYAAFKNFSELNQKKFKETDQLKKFILSMWDERRSHFWSGTNVSGEINKSELYLDNQTWSLLALDKELIPNAKDALDLNCETLLVEHKGVKGFQDSKPTRGPASETYVWSEGTLGQVLAMRKISEKYKCDGMNSEDFIKSIEKMKSSDGGIAYATTKNSDFTTSSSVAGTAWLYFAKKNINPFQIN